MTESDLYELEKQNIPGAYTRIENSISSGIFDVHLTTNCLGHWIENKIRRGNVIKVRGTQMVWGREQLLYGLPNLWFIVGTDKKLPPKLYRAAAILPRCDLNRTDGKGHILVDISDLEPAATGWAAISARLWGDRPGN